MYAKVVKPIIVTNIKKIPANKIEKENGRLLWLQSTHVVILTQ